jgi:phospholipid/cholesterol/gamma-HCH transport system substrate-binding protein
MTREAKLGLLVIITAFLTIWGYKFIKGKDLFSKTIELKTTYSDVTGLAVSSPVLVNGFKIGTVTNIDLSPTNVKEMIVTLSIESGYNIPKEAVAIMFSESIVGGKSISIEFEKPCDGNQCLQDGDMIASTERGMLTSMLGGDDVNDYITTASTELSNTINTLGADGQKGQVHESVRHINETMNNLSKLTESLNNMVVSNQKNLNGILANVNTVTKSLSDNNKGISEMIDNLSKITSEFKDAKLGESSSLTMAEAKDAIKELNTTLSTTKTTMDNLGAVVNKINEGEGSLGKLINEKELYDNLEFTSKNLGLLLQDLRMNPKRYVNVSVFGKSQKDYQIPEEDPAFKE